MKKTILKLITAILVFGISVFCLTACADRYEVELPMGKSDVEDDSVICHYVIDGEFSDGYELKGWFEAESKADLSDRFIFSLSFDNRFSQSISENVLFAFDGAQLASANNKLQFSIKFEKLSNSFKETEEPTFFAFHFHREGAKGTDLEKWNESSYKYTFDGKTVKIEK